MSVKTSAELQYTVLSSLVKDTSLMTLVVNDIKLNFFDDSKYQYIYKLLLMYFSKYNKVPSNHELLVMTTQYHQEPYGDLVDIQELVKSCYASPRADERFVIDSITDFIKRSKFEEILTKTIDNYQSKNEFNIEKVVEQIVDTYQFELTGIDLYNPNNVEDYKRSRVKALGNNDNPIIIKSSINGFNKALQYKGYKYGDLATIVAAPGVGKSTFMVQESVYSAIQGYNVLHIVLGDMSEYSIQNKMMSNATEIEVNRFTDDPELYGKVLMSDPKLKALNPLSRIRILAYAPGEKSVSQLVNIVKQVQESENMHFDVIVVDYADNLAEETVQMYSSAGKIYDKLKALAQNNHSVVITASQPKIGYFEEEVIPFTGLAESSRKQHVVDICITIGKPRRDADIATFHCAKLREGNTGELLRLKLDMAKNRMTEITIDEYLNFRAELLDPNKAK